MINRQSSYSANLGSVLDQTTISGDTRISVDSDYFSILPSMDFDCQEKNDQNLQLFISNLDLDTTTAELTKDETELSSSHGKISESEIDCDLSEYDLEYAERQRSMTLEQFDAILSDTDRNENDNFYMIKVSAGIFFFLCALNLDSL